mmetsp:Transcript_5902/g.7449  ORF Transcript_5902/g.7449 Transcript_5902/m.7449 type:complete len:434 (+) Transcript_5902:60-1361(+)
MPPRHPSSFCSLRKTILFLATTSSSRHAGIGTPFVATSAFITSSSSFVASSRRKMAVLKTSMQRSVACLSLSDLNVNQTDRQFFPPPKFRGLFAGSGSGCLSDATFAKEILQLLPPSSPSRRRSEDGGPNVLYLGTATYDLPAPRARQTDRLKELGCTINSLDVSIRSPSQSDIRTAIESADIILVGGGNTLYAVDRWTRLGMIPLLREASERGAVLAGGSAGAIWVFDGGHSDSADPDTFRRAMLDAAAAGINAKKGMSQCEEEHEDESSAAPASGKETKDWKYVRVPGLGFLPGLCCPHGDMVQSNGVPRSDDFDEMLLRHDGERGICIDHWAALLIKGGEYRIVCCENRPGSVVIDRGTSETKFCPDRTGKPGVWIKECVNGVIEQSLCPPEGKVSDILRFPTKIVDNLDELEKCRRANPDVAHNTLQEF